MLRNALVLGVSLESYILELLGNARCSPGMYPMRSLSAAILDVVANPRAVQFLADTSLLENMSLRKCSKVNSIARVITNPPASSSLTTSPLSQATLSLSFFLLETPSHKGTSLPTMAIPRNSLGAFLRQAKSNLKRAIDQKEKVTLVIGNESAGLFSLTLYADTETDTC